MSQRGAGANMSVDVATGEGSLQRPAGDYSYYAWADTTQNVTISSADPSNPRIDAVVAYVDLSVVDSSSDNNPGALKFKAVTGTPAGSPSAPSGSAIQTSVGASNPYILLAYVSVAAAASSIVNANITDKRSPMALLIGYLWGGASNTKGHTVPNVADDTVALLAATQALTNKTMTGSTNKVTSGGASSSLVDSAGIQLDIEGRARTTFQNFFEVGGCVWSTSSGLVGTMTSGYVWINGKRLTVAAITSKTFTASKDTYVDFLDNGDGTAVPVYSTSSNNAASQSLASNSVRSAIVITNGSAITSINQGAPSATGPTVGSHVLLKFDSLGNPIYPTQANRTLIGYVELTSQFTSSTVSSTPNAITGLGTTVIVPSDANLIKARAIFPKVVHSATNNLKVSFWDGTVASGTFMGRQALFMNASTTHQSEAFEANYAVTAGGSKTINVGYAVDSGNAGTLTMYADARTTDGPIILEIWAVR